MGNRGPQTEAISARVAFFALFLCLVWGGMFPAIKIGLRGIPPLGTAGVRFLLAWVTLLLWCRARNIALSPTRREWLPLSAMGLVFAVQIAALNAGADLTSGAHTSVFLSTNPLFVAVLSHFFLKGDRLSASKVLGLVVAFLGIWVVFSDQWETGLNAQLRGDLTVFLSGFLLGCIIVYTKYLIETVDLHKIIMGEFTVGVPLFFLAGGLAEGFGYRFSLPVTLAVVYQGIAIGGFAFVAWTRLLKRFPASSLSAFSFSTPVFGILLSALLLSEPISLRLALGTGLVGVGIYLVNRSRANPRDA